MYGEHFVFSALMTALLLGSFLVISLVMLWAPSKPFPQSSEDAHYQDTSDDEEPTAQQ